MTSLPHPTSAAGSGRPDFVGRTEQLDALSRLLRPQTGGARLVLVGGEAGIGKTRLVRELADRAGAGGHLVVTGRCWDDRSTPAHWPWTQVIRKLQGASTGTELAQFLPVDTDASDRFALFDAAAAALHDAAVQRPLLVVLDDLHLADVPTLDLTRYVIAHVTDAPVLVVATYRPDEAAARADAAGLFADLREQAHTIELTGLDLAEVTALVGDRAAAREVLAATGGNPLFVEQVVRSRRDGSPASGPTAATDTRTALRAVLRRRLETLAPGTTDLVGAVGILGPRADRESVAAVLGASSASIEPLAEQARAGGFLDPDDWSTSHPLVAEEAVAALPSSRRAAMHRAAAEHLTTHGASAAERAHHLHRAGPAYVDAAIRACCEAAEAATAAFAHDDAVAHYRRAGELLGDEPRDVATAFEVTFALAGALERTEGRVPAEAAYDRALELAHRTGEPELIARAAARHGISFYADDHANAARARECRAALDLVPLDDHPVRARLLATLAASRIGAPESRSVADDAVAMARRLDDPLAVGAALVAEQVTDLGPSTLRRRLRSAREIVALGEAIDSAELAVRGRFLLKNALLEHGDARGLDAELVVQDRVVNEISDLRFARHSLWFRCMRAMLDGDAERIEVLAKECLAIAEQLQDPDGHGVYVGQLGVALWMQGKLVELEPLYLELMRAEPDEPLWPAVVGWVWLGEGRTDAARGILERLPRPSDIPSSMHTLLNLFTMADLVAEVGDLDLVSEVREVLLPFVDRVVPVAMGAACFGAVARPLGGLALRLGRVDEAISHYERAIAVAARLGARPWLVDAQLALAAALLGSGRTGDHRLPRLVAEAAETVDRLDLTVFRDRLDALTDVRGVSPADAAASPPAVAAEPAPTGRVQVDVLGTFEVRAIDGSTPKWTSRKARTLLKILVSRRGVPVAREVVADLLWPGEAPDAVANRMSVALTTVRRALDPSRSLSVSDLVQSEAGALRLVFDAVDVDVEAFLGSSRTALAAARRGDPEADALLQGAMALYGGEALPDEPYEPWADELRSTVTVSYLEVLRAVASRAVASGDPLAASDAFRRLLEVDPFDEPAHLGLVTTLSKLGAHGQAQAAHRRYSSSMAELGVPSVELADIVG